MSYYAALGNSEYDALATTVVEYLNAGDYHSVVGLLGGYSAAELQAITARAVALGADPATMQQIIATLGKTEVIEVTGTAPRSTNWLLIGGIAGILGIWAYTQYAAKKAAQ